MDDRSSPAPVKKPTRAEKRARNRAAMLQTQAAEYGQAAGEPLTVRELRQWEREGLAHRAAPSAFGRPCEYTERVGEELCGWIAGGGSLRGWCREHGCSMETVYRWLRQFPHFQARYALAHEDRADTLADEMLDIADDCAVAPTIEGVAAAKLRVETRRFIASKLRPQKWGERQTVEHVGAVSIRIGIPQRANVIEAEALTQQTPLPPVSA